MSAAVPVRSGYSLMEAMVALFVLAVASTGLLLATRAHTSTASADWRTGSPPIGSPRTAWPN